MARSLSLAESFFADIISAPDKAAFIRGLINPSNPTFETDWRDFKLEPDKARSKDYESKLKAMWYEALSGFANNQGGVLIWGVDGRKDPATQVDAALGENPIKNALAFKSRLLELQRHATNPPLGNVPIEVCDIQGSPGEGFVVCLVPEGPFKPYRAETSGSPQYHIRMGDSFHVASPALLRTLFYPRLTVNYEIEIELTWNPLHKDGKCWARFFADGLIRSCGSATARDTYVVLRTEIKTSWWPSGGCRLYEDWLQRDNILGQFAFEARRPLHPGSAFKMFMGEWHAPSFEECPDPKFSFLIFADNQASQRVEVSFDMDELHANRQSTRKSVSVGDS